LEGDILGSEHFYVQVSGKYIDADFSTTGAGEGPLQYRPKHYVPFHVPIYDESKTRQARNAATYLGRKATDIPAVYQWPYRPEMQFSVFDLEVKKIKRTDTNGAVVDILPAGSDSDPNSIPALASSDVNVDLLYNLIQTEFNGSTVLDPFGPQRELIFAFGEHEIPASIEADKTISFKNLSDLSQLQPEDFLSIRLYQNSDMENILWEFAFSLKPEPLPYTAFVTADDAKIDLSVYLPGHEIDQNKPPKKVTIRWDVAGPTGGSITNPITSSSNGIFTNTLTTSKHAKDEFMVTATVVASEDEKYVVGTKSTFGPFIVTTGEPYRLELGGDINELPLDTLSTATVKLTAYDANNNLLADGTPVEWRIDYDGELLSSTTNSISNGESNAVYRVGDKSLPTSVVAKVGNAESSFTINKRPLNVVASSSSTTLRTRTTESAIITVTATDPSGASVPDGTPVDWSNAVGVLTDAQPSLINGKATAILTAGNVPGEGMVLAVVAGQEAKITIQHVPNLARGTYATFEHAAIVAAPSNGVVTIDTLGGPVNHAYINTTNLTIHGAPGATFNLSAGGFYTPNAEPDIHFAMNGTTEDQNGINVITDIKSGVVAKIFGDVAEDNLNAFTVPGTSLAFNGGHLIVGNTPEIEIKNDLFINLRFRANSSNEDQVLIRKGTGTVTAYSLKLINGGTTLMGEVETDTGTYTTQISAPVVTGTWYIAGLRIRNGQLQIGLNEFRSSVAISGVLQGENTGVAIGGAQFIGNIDDINIGSETIGNALVTFAGGGISQSISLDTSGTATVAVSATGNLPLMGHRVGFSIDNGVSVTENEQQKDLNYVDVATNILFSLVGINSAYASEVAGQQEAGLVIAKPESWGYIAEWVGKRFFGENFDAIKRAAIFVAQLTSISDVYVLVKNIVALIRGGNDFDGFETTFAVIGVGITVAGIFTGGTALSLKGGMLAVKPVLKALFETGAKDILKVMVIAGKYLFRLVKDIITDPKVAKQSLKELADSFIAIVKDTSGGLFRALYKIVRSPLDLAAYIRVTARGGKCFAINEFNGSQQLRYANSDMNFPTGVMHEVASEVVDLLVGKNAYAAGACIEPMLYIKSVAADTGVYGARAANIARDMTHSVDFLQKQGINVTAEMMSGMQSFAKAATLNGKQGTLKNLIKRYATRLDNGMTPQTSVSEVLHLIEKYEKSGKDGVAGAISVLGGTVGRGVNDSKADAVRFAMRYLERDSKLKNAFSGFEVAEDVIVDGVKLRARRYDAVANGIDLEVKNWSSGAKQWKKAVDKLNDADLENFLAGTGKVSRSGEEVEWISDVLKHAPAFDNLKWVINSKASGVKLSLKQDMLDVLENKKLRTLFEKKLGGSEAVDVMIRNFKKPGGIFDKVVTFAEDLPVSNL